MRPTADTQSEPHINITLLKTGETFEALKPHEGCYETWFAHVFGERVRWQVIDAPKGDLLPQPESIEHLVISGSPVSVYERLAWSVACSEWIGRVWEREIPILGVCYGHQLLADALGGEVSRSPQGREMGAVTVQQRGTDPIFDGLGAQFDVWQTHIDEVSRLPAQAEIIAENDHCLVQAMSIGAHCRSVQWHPEMNQTILAHYIQERIEVIDAAWGEGAALTLKNSLPDVVPSGPVIASNFLERFCGIDPVGSSSSSPR